MTTITTTPLEIVTTSAEEEFTNESETIIFYGLDSGVSSVSYRGFLSPDAELFMGPNQRLWFVTESTDAELVPSGEASSSSDPNEEAQDAAIAALVATVSASTLTGVLDDSSNSISGHVITPDSDTENGLIIQAPDATYGSSQVYGTGQALLVLGSGAGSVHNTLVKARIDGYTGGAGFAGGLHSAAGLHWPSGFATATQNAWIQNYADMVGLVISAYGETPTHDLIDAATGSGAIPLFTVTSNGVVNVGSQSASDYTYLSLARGTKSNEGVLAVAASSGQFAASAAAGDVVLAANKSGGGTVRIGGMDSDLAPTSHYARLLVDKDGVTFYWPESSSSGRAIGSLGFFGFRHNDYSTGQLIMDASGGTFLNAASDAHPITFEIATTTVAQVKSTGIVMNGGAKLNSVAAPTLAAVATDPATTQTLANSLRSALVTLGLCA
jgi:hypothetical protein